MKPSRPREAVTECLELSCDHPISKGAYPVKAAGTDLIVDENKEMTLVAVMEIVGPKRYKGLSFKVRRKFQKPRRGN